MPRSGYPADHPQRAIARQSIEKLLVVHDDEAYCQPCVSPIWDTGLACHALLEAGGERVGGARSSAASIGSCRCRCSTCAATGSRGGPSCGPAAGRSNMPIRIIPTSTTPRWWRWRWTACRACCRRKTAPRSVPADYRAAIARAREWIVGMQSENGGWGAFDADNEYYYLNNIPFADHGALLDPPTEDVTARCLSMLAQFGDTQSPAVTRAVDYLRTTQLADGSLVRPLGHELHLRHLVGALRAQRRGRCRAMRRKCARRPIGSPRSRTTTAAGARTAQATSSTTKATRKRRRPPRRPPGRCSA